jgi:hypothetical protein
MPKTGPSAGDWRNRLKQYARGQFTFQRGQKPKPGSVWATALLKIDKCPQHRNDSLLNAMGKPIECSCGYHDKPSSKAKQSLSLPPTSSSLQPPLTTQFQEEPPDTAITASPSEQSQAEPPDTEQPCSSGLQSEAAPSPKRPRHDKTAHTEVGVLVIFHLCK